jgi:hypothetical protein
MTTTNTAVAKEQASAIHHQGEPLNAAIAQPTNARATIVFITKMSPGKPWLLPMGVNSKSQNKTVIVVAQIPRTLAVFLFIIQKAAASSEE